MSSYNKYLIRGMPANLILYYLITISIFIINILIILSLWSAYFYIRSVIRLRPTYPIKRSRSILFPNTIFLSFSSFRVLFRYV